MTGFQVEKFINLEEAGPSLGTEEISGRGEPCKLRALGKAEALESAKSGKGLYIVESRARH